MMIAPASKEPDDVKRETGEYCPEIRKGARIVKKMVTKSIIRRSVGEIEGF